MAEPLYGLTPRTADQLRAVLADGGRTGGRQTAGSEGAGVTWVRVTGEANEDGWHPGLVNVESGPGWVEGTMRVLVAAADAAELTEGQRYLCTRTGNATDGTARFRAVLGGAVEYHTNQDESIGGTLVVVSGWTVSDPLATVEPGTWLVVAVLQFGASINLGGGGIVAVDVELNRTEVGGAGAFNISNGTVRLRVTAGDDEQQMLTLAGVVTVDEPTEFRVYGAVDNPTTATGTWGISPSGFFCFRLAGPAPGSVSGLNGTFGG